MCELVYTQIVVLLFGNFTEYTLTTPIKAKLVHWKKMYIVLPNNQWRCQIHTVNIVRNPYTYITHQLDSKQKN